MIAAGGDRLKTQQRLPNNSGEMMLTAAGDVSRSMKVDPTSKTPYSDATQVYLNITYITTSSNANKTRDFFVEIFW